MVCKDVLNIDIKKIIRWSKKESHKKKLNIFLKCLKKETKII